jgi:hypothetical protein
MIFMRIVFFSCFLVIIAWGGRCTRSAFPQNPVSCFGLFHRCRDVGLLSSSSLYIYTLHMLHLKIGKG